MSSENDSSVSSVSRQSSRETRVYVYWLMAAWILTVCAIGLLLSAQTATWALAISLFVLACAYLFLPQGILPQVRSRLIDAATCTVLALLLAFFASWASTPLII